MSKIDFDKIENIEVDCIVGFGAACRIASSLKRNKLRLYSNPFDWQMRYSLEQVIKLLKNKGKTFYNNCSENESFASGNTTGIVDESGMVSMHDYTRGLPIEKAPKFFSMKYKNRFKNLDKFLRRAKKILILTYRNMNIESMEDFVNKFSKIYKYEHLYFIDIYDTNNIDKEFIEVLKKDRVTFIRYCFNDAHPNGRDKTTNPAFWLHKIKKWKKNILM